MGLSSALSIATSGLRANSVQSDLIARNIANASTPGYTRKSAELINQNGAVFVNGINREVDGLLDQLDRGNTSDVARTRTVAEGLTSYTNLLGQPTDETSPAAGVAQLYTSLITVSGTPDSLAAQHGVLEMAANLVRQVNDLASTANELANEVEINIRYDVADVNERLTRLSQINSRLMQTGDNGVEAAELKDEMNRILDEVSGYLDIRVTSYGDGAVNVYTGGGTELLTGKTVNMLRYDSGLDKLYAGDIEVTPAQGGARGFTSGSLAGLFELSTNHIPKIQRELDGFAGILLQRFKSADPTLAPGEDGIFVDAAALGSTAPLRLTGLAARLRLNEAVDPGAGGDPSLLVKGLGTASTLPNGSPAIVENLMRALDLRSLEQTPLGEGLSITDYASAMVATHQQQRVSAERAADGATVSGAAIAASRQNLQGVNIDDEMQKLLVVEQSFAANAKVLTSVQIMLDTLLDAV